MSDKLITLELRVNNHPGVMMHIVSLFARRAFNLEGIACFPCRDKTMSRVWLRVFEDEKLDQIIAQLSKLLDVLDIEQKPPSHESFAKMETFFHESSSADV